MFIKRMSHRIDEIKPIDDKMAPLYWDGATNRFARYFAYMRRAIGLVNEAKYLLALFGLGVIKSDFVIPAWLITFGGLISVPVLIAIGRWHLFRVQKAEEFINNRHGSITGYNSYNMTIRMVELLEEISKKLNGRK